ncbi:MAG: zf-HC2 domain-containing protein [Acidobacteria bacterium]|nr:zf-HC2 domain-containing protein [Acidobacteriota bacterium]
MARTTIFTCDEADERLEAYLDGDLSEFEAARLKRHLSTCTACAAELAWAERVQHGLRALPEHTCPPQVLEDVLRNTSQAPARAPRATPTQPGLTGWAPARADAHPAAGASSLALSPPQRRLAWSTLLRAAALAASVGLVAGLLWRLPSDGPDPADRVATQPAPAVAPGHLRPEPLHPESLQPEAVPPSVEAPVPATTAGRPSAQEVRQARAELRIALTALDDVNRRAARILRDRALGPHVAEAPGTVLEHLDRQL